MICHLFWYEVAISNDIPFAFVGSYVFIAAAVVHLINKEAIISPNPRVV